LALAAALSGYGLYRLSLHLHAQFGETFKAVFDLHRKNLPVEETFSDILDEIVNLTGQPGIKAASPRQQYRAIWRYLHNYRVKLTGTGPALTPGEVRQELDAQKKSG
jgi:hypothetical protein